VGTKLDLKYDKPTMELLKTKNEKPISFEEGVQKSHEVGAIRYMECSALNHTGLKDVFVEVMKTGVHPPSREKKKPLCILL
jgi:Ras-related C3 botulinum toxin substrate 1